MQYQTYTTGDFVEYTDGVALYRTISRGGMFCIDETLTAIGFDGAESLDGGTTGDWVNIDSWAKIGTTGIFRDGVRNGDFVLDEALTPLGFDGAESIDEGITGDWINVYIFE